MAKLLSLAALLAAGATSAHAQTTPVARTTTVAQTVPAAAIHPSEDSVRQRQDLRALTACLAQSRPRWARRTLSHPYLSTEQAREAAGALSGNDNCVRQPEMEFTFRTSGVVGNLAEHFIDSEIRSVDFHQLAKALNALAPLNASEDFALCVASRNPAAARDLVLSEPGSATESSAAKLLAASIPPCTEQGEKLTVDLQSLRSLMSVALYRGVTTLLASRS